MVPMTPSAAIRQRRIGVAESRAIWYLIVKTIVLVAAIFVIFGLLFGLTPMKGGDMQPKYAAGDLLLYYRLQDTYARNDVAVMEREGAQYVGRVIGIPGDIVEITGGNELVVNGNRIVERSIFYKTEAFADATSYPLELANDEYFLLGDYREAAKDSRYFGAVKSYELKGRVITVIKRTDI